MKERRINEIRGVILVAAALIIFASLISFDYLDLPFYTSHPNTPPRNLIRIFGAYLAGSIIFLFGRPTSFFIPLFIFWLGIRLFQQRMPYLRIPQAIGIPLLLVSMSSLFGISIRNENSRFLYSGLSGSLIAYILLPRIGLLGGYISFITLGLLGFVLTTEMLISTFYLNAVNRIKSFVRSIFTLKAKAKPLVIRPSVNGKRESKEAPSLSTLKSKTAETQALPRPALTQEPKIKIKTKPAEFAETKVRPQELKIGDYRLPSLDLLDSPPPFEARQIKEDLAANARILEETMEDFGVSVKVTDIERGPVITRYELEPAPGVKVNKIVALSDDIALAMKAQSVRVIAPIPGKGRVGVEVPNIQSSLVYLREVFSSAEFQKAESKLTLVLGKDISGQPVVTDLGDMPHLLIAGTTGSGKTVCVNCSILAMLFRSTPNELKFLMIDPKMVELAPFNGLPHLLCPVVTDAKKAAVALNWVVSEMEERYRLLAKVGSRNIDSYNEKQERIPYIVVIVDELADLMMVSRDQIENAITRLAQLSRAVGIHLLLATQRPSVDVITGVIKANFPARISFKVASKVDSRTVLDTNGADKLLGRGDLLFLRPGESKLTRAQGSLVSDKEIERVVDFIKSQAEPVYDEEILKEQHSAILANGQKDELYEQAVRIIMESNQASVSILQRRLRLGYTRAARIIDTMEQEGMVGPFEGSKPRKILIDRDAWLKNTVAQQES